MSKPLTNLFEDHRTSPEGEVMNDYYDCDVEQYVDEDTGKLIETRKPWTIISALDRVLAMAQKSELSEEFWKKSRGPIDFLCRTLGLSKVQVVFLSILVEEGDAMTWRGFSKFLGCTRLSVMVHSDELEDLVAKRWVYRQNAREMGKFIDGFALMSGVVKALRHNMPFVPDRIEGFTTQEFVDKMESHIPWRLHRRTHGSLPLHPLPSRPSRRPLLRLLFKNTLLEMIAYSAKSDSLFSPFEK